MIWPAEIMTSALGLTPMGQRALCRPQLMGVIGGLWLGADSDHLQVRSETTGLPSQRTHRVH
jgi:hypothetical protein